MSRVMGKDDSKVKVLYFTFRVLGKDDSAGIKNFILTALSKIRASIGMTDIGRRSEGEVGLRDFGIGWMMADFHCAGKTEVFSDRLNKCDRGAAKECSA